MTLFRSEGANYDENNDEGTLPSDVRRGYQGLFSSTGVLPGSSSPLVEGAGDFTYTVHTGYWVTSRGGSDGFHYWGNVGDISVPTSVAPAAGLSRIDIIYALHPSAGENGDTTSQPVVAVAQGTEASSPVAPSLPVGALELARNTMTSAATSTASAGNSIAQTAGFASIISPAPGPGVSVSAAAGFSSSANARTMGGFDVQLEGVISGPLAHATQVGTVPSGLRPAADGYYAAACSGQSSSLPQALRVRITPSGGVYVYDPPTGASEVHLNGIRYRRPYTP